MIDLHIRCIIDAIIEPLTRYRRGYARTKQGPFYYERTIRKLIADGSLRRTHTGRSGQVTARAA